MVLACKQACCCRLEREKLPALIPTTLLEGYFGFLDDTDETKRDIIIFDFEEDISEPLLLEKIVALVKEV